MILEIVAFISFIVALLLVILYLYFRDKGFVKRLELYEMAIDDLSTRLDSLESKGGDDSVLKNMETFSKELTHVEQELNVKLNDLSDPLLKTIRAVKDMEIELKRINDSVNERISKLEENTKLSTMSTSAKLINEKAIIDLYKAGYSAQEIAKKERTPIGEVELILRIANLK